MINGHIVLINGQRTLINGHIVLINGQTNDQYMNK